MKGKHFRIQCELYSQQTFHVKLKMQCVSNKIINSSYISSNA